MEMTVVVVVVIRLDAGKGGKKETLRRVVESRY